jgi:hypothetical protein
MADRIFVLSFYPSYGFLLSALFSVTLLPCTLRRMKAYVLSLGRKSVIFPRKEDQNLLLKRPVEGSCEHGDEPSGSLKLLGIF